MGIDRAIVRKEMNIHGFAYLLRLLKVRDYRRCVSRCEEEDLSDMKARYQESNKTTHFRVLWRGNYDLAQSLRDAAPSLTSQSAKKRRLSGFKVTPPPYQSVLTDLTKAEFSTWPKDVKDDLDQSATYRT